MKYFLPHHRSCKCANMLVLAVIAYCACISAAELPFVEEDTPEPIKKGEYFKMQLTVTSNGSPVPSGESFWNIEELKFPRVKLVARLALSNKKLANESSSEIERVKKIEDGTNPQDNLKGLKVRLSIGRRQYTSLVGKDGIAQYYLASTDGQTNPFTVQLTPGAKFLVITSPNLSGLQTDEIVMQGGQFDNPDIPSLLPADLSGKFEAQIAIVIKVDVLEQGEIDPSTNTKKPLNIYNRKLVVRYNYKGRDRIKQGALDRLEVRDPTGIVGLVRKKLEKPAFIELKRKKTKIIKN